jgi:iron complex transport system ATP-binding protein
MQTLELKDIDFSYGNTKIISSLSLSLRNGELAAIIGPNGSGKSTALKIASGILAPNKGQALLWNKDVNLYPSRERAKLVSYLPQHLELSVPFTTLELAGMGRYPYNDPPRLSPTDALSIVGLSGKAEQAIGALSGGERQRAFIAMMLVQGSGALLLDEPLANLDIKYQIELVKLLKAIVAKGDATCLMALHDITTAMHFDRVFILKNGSLHSSGAPREIITPELLSEVFEVTKEDLLMLPGIRL